MTDNDAHALAMSVLAPGESLLWSEAAPAWPLFWAGFFGALFSAGLFVVLSGVAKNGPARGVPPWIAAGAIILFQIVCCFGFVANATQAASAWSTAYAITDQRVIIAAGDPWLSVNEYFEADIVYYVIDGQRLSFSSYHGRRGAFTDFHDLEDPEQALALIHENVAPLAEPF